MLEDLKISAMSRKGKHKKWLNREFRFVRHSEIVRKIEIVAARRGIKVVRVNPKNTSKECHCCKVKGVRKREDFTCETCGMFHADGNAAVNILQRGGGKYPTEVGITFVRRELVPWRKQVEPGGLHAFECRLIPTAISRRKNQVCPVPRSVG